MTLTATRAERPPAEVDAGTINIPPGAAKSFCMSMTTTAVCRRSTPYLPPFGNGGKPAILYCFGFFLLVFTGGGAYALDSRRRTRTVATTRGGFRDWRRRSR